MRLAALTARCIALALLILNGAHVRALDNPFAPDDPANQGMNVEALDRLAQAVAGIVERDEAVGAEVLVIKNRRTVLHRAYGWKDRESQTAWPIDSIVCIRSMTKPLVGAAIQMLIDDGRLSLDTRAAEHVPSFDNDKCRAITVEHLLTHRSGLSLSSLLGTPLSEIDSAADVAALAGARGPDFEPGTDFNYSDDGVDTLVAIITAITGQPAEDFIRARLLEPLGMRNTILHLKADDAPRDRLVSPYAGRAKAWRRYWNPLEDEPIFPCFLGSQSAYSTAADYAQFLAMMMDDGAAGADQVLSPEAVARTRAPRSETGMPSALRDIAVRYGQLMTVNVSPDTHYGSFGHAGSDGTHAYAFPELDLIVLYLTQSRGGTSFLEFEQALDRFVLRPELFAGETAPTAPAAERFEPFVGFYWLERGDTYAFTHVRNGVPILEFPAESAYELVPDPDGDDAHWQFRIAPQVRVVFDRDEAGDVASLSMVLPGRTERLERFEPAADLPSLDDVIGRTIEAHHADQLDTLGVVRLAGAIRSTQQGATTDGTIEVLFEGTKRMYQRLDIGGVVVQVAVDGQTVRMRTGEGDVQVIEGPMATAMLIDRAAVLIGDWRRWFESITVLRRVTSGSKNLLFIHAVPKGSNACMIVLDEETSHLRLKATVTELPGLGAAGQITEYGDFRDVGGMLLPFSVETRYSTPLLGRSEVTYESAEVNVTVDERAFELRDAP
jgi:CubicO group peptidase (beta-lactamase class C family)